MLAALLVWLFEAIWRAGSRGRNPARLSLSRVAQPAQMMATPEIPCRTAWWDQTAHRDVRRNKEAPNSRQINPTTSKGLTRTQRLSKSAAQTGDVESLVELPADSTKSEWLC
ncbi:hypothetical protein SRHO_G00131320 [Serrasalmus rhombeus]